MAELTFDIVDLVLKGVRDACKKNKECDGCRFQEITRKGKREWYSCRISSEPHMWLFADKKDGKDTNVSICTDCILDGTDACNCGASRAVDDEICERFMKGGAENG